MLSVLLLVIQDICMILSMLQVRKLILKKLKQLKATKFKSNRIWIEFQPVASLLAIEALNVKLIFILFTP